MAITTIGAPLSGIRGTIGGITFSANKSGTYAKLWAPPSNPNSPPQSIQRGYIARQPQNWAGMAPALRADWDTFAALPAQELTNSLGQAYYATGCNWFTKCNVRVLRHGGAAFTAVPVVPRPAAPTITELRICPTGTESDQCICGVASSSSERPGNLSANAFNDNLASYWRTIETVTAAWIRYDHCDPVNIKRYRIYPLAGHLTKAPKDWTFQVFTGGNWEIIHTVSGESYASAHWYEYACPNPYTETRYLLDITANQGDPGSLLACEIEMYLADVGYSVIIYPEDEFNPTPQLALVLFISMSNSTARTVQYPGYYLVVSDIAPGRSHYEFQAALEEVFGSILLNRQWFSRAHAQTSEGIRSPMTASNVLTLGTS